MCAKPHDDGFLVQVDVKVKVWPWLATLPT